MYTKASSIDDLISKSPFSEVMKKIDELVASNTKLERHYFDNGRTFSSIAYGRIGNLGKKNYDYADAGMINITSQKNFVGLYIWSGDVIEKYADEFPKSTISKGCINIKDMSFLDKYSDVLKKIISETK